MDTLLKRISSVGIIPVIKIEDLNTVLPLSQALYDGGIPAAEVTFRTKLAPDAIRMITENQPDMLVGAGTVLTCEQVDLAIDAGAKFIVSPGLNPSVVSYCIKKGILIIPGVSTPSEIETAIGFGLTCVKFFPAGECGGIKFLKAVSGPYGNMKYIPTGGVNASNINEYLSFPKVLACGGSWMVKPELVKAGNFDSIRELSAEAVRTMLSFELAHIGINCVDEEEAMKTAKLFCKLFHLSCKPGNSSIFAGNMVECMKQPSHGEKGHIGIKTNSVERAVFHLQSMGFEFNEETKKTDADGSIKAIYLAQSFSGFAIHLMKKQ